MSKEIELHLISQREKNKDHKVCMDRKALNLSVYQSKYGTEIMKLKCETTIVGAKHEFSIFFRLYL